MNYIIITTRKRFNKELEQEREKARKIAIGDVVDVLKNKKGIYLNRITIKGKPTVKDNAFVGCDAGIQVYTKGVKASK